MSAIYVETSIVGYLTARSASDVVFQARQELTRRWWQKRREGFDLYISQLVLDEAGGSTRRPGYHRWRRLLVDVELQAHRKCGFAAGPV